MNDFLEKSQKSMQRCSIDAQLQQGVPGVFSNAGRGAELVRRLARPGEARRLVHGSRSDARQVRPVRLIPVLRGNRVKS